MNPLRKLIKESISKLLSESVSLHVKDFSYTDNLDHILDISHYVLKKVAYDLWPKLGLTPQQEEEIGGITDVFTPDGSDAFEKEGIMNFYAARFPEEITDKILSYIKYILNEKDIKVGEFKKERIQGGVIRVVRVPIISNESADSGNPPEIGLSNTNATDLFGRILGFQGDGAHFEVDAADLIMKINEAREALVSRKDIPDKTYTKQQGNFYSDVKGKDYYFRMLDIIQNFAQWTLDRGYRRIYTA